MRKILEEDGASLRSVSGELLESSWLHLTCHRFQDIQQPFESCFYLYNSSLQHRGLAANVRYPCDLGTQSIVIVPLMEL